MNYDSVAKVGQPHWVAPTKDAIVGTRNGILLKNAGNHIGSWASS